MKAFQKIISFVLLISVTLYSVGITTNRMVCLKSGKVKTSLSLIKDCCNTNDTSGKQLKKNCCDYSSSSFVVDDYSASEVFMPEFTPSSFDCTSLISFSSIENNSSNSYFFTAKFPPSKYGRGLLSFISVLLI